MYILCYPVAIQNLFVFPGVFGFFFFFLENCSCVWPVGLCCARVRPRCCTHSAVAAAAVDSSASPGRADRSRDRNNRCRRMCARRRGGVPHRAPPPPHRCTPYIVPTVLDRIYRVVRLMVVIRLVGFVRCNFPLIRVSEEWPKPSFTTTTYRILFNGEGFSLKLSRVNGLRAMSWTVCFSRL